MDGMDRQTDLWHKFAKDEKLTEHQLLQFQTYWDLIQEWNKVINLTAIVDIEDAISYHFQDSLALAHFIDIQKLSFISDVGSGAGFPGIPLKIMYPHVELMLIEVNRKKISFLEEVIAKLALDTVTISDLDWRNFLRNTEYPIELFCARASLPPEDLIHMFKMSCVYNKAQLVYWASEHWKPRTKAVEQYISKYENYHVGSKERKLVFFAAQ